MNGRVGLAKLEERALAAGDLSAEFSLVTSLVAKTLKCDVAFVTFFDADKQRFVSVAGACANFIPASLPNCSFGDASHAALLIADATCDSRFSDHPLVQGPLGLRSYLGMPLRTARGVIIGALCAVSSSPNAFSDDDKEIMALFATLVESDLARNLSNRKLRAEKADLIALNSLANQGEKTGNMGSWQFDLVTRKFSVSQNLSEIFRLTDCSDLKLRDAIWFFVHEDQPALRKAFSDALRYGRSFRTDVGITLANGDIRRVCILGERVEAEGKHHAVAGLVLAYADENQGAIALAGEPERDRLTKLLTRSSFLERLQAQHGTDSGTSLIAALLNVDGFKYVNDILGHMAGDRLLLLLADQIRAFCSRDSFAARWGDDEFALSFPAGTPLEEAYGFCEQLVASLSKEVLLPGGEISVSITCGLAQASWLDPSSELMRRVELALHHGKECGRGSVHCWNEQISAASSTRQRAMNMLHSAFSEGRVFAAYQPIVSLETGDVVGVEALLRVRDSLGRVVTATDLLPAIMEPTMSRRISRFMLTQIINDAPQLYERYGNSCQIGFNVSDADLRAPDAYEDFVSRITRLVPEASLSPQNIVLEITETMLLQDEDGYIQDGLRALAFLGYSIALDDFGTGYSSLTHLRDFPIKKVKIDKGFVSAISSDHQSRMIIQAIVQMSRSLGLEVVAEGVENASEEAYLRAVGCHYAQGYRYGKPTPITDFSARGSAWQATSMELIPSAL